MFEIQIPRSLEVATGTTGTTGIMFLEVSKFCNYLEVAYFQSFLSVFFV